MSAAFILFIAIIKVIIIIIIKLIHKIRLGLAPPHVLSQLNWFHQSSATQTLSASLSLAQPLF